MAWVPHRLADKRRRSAVELARLALAATDLIPEHRAWLLSGAVWKYTEADGKWNTRHRSRDAVGIHDTGRLNHEHVYQRKWLRVRMLEQPDRYEELMALAVGCVVTREEHARLTAQERIRPDLAGWDRYANLGIEVVDLAGEAPERLPPRARGAPSSTSGRRGYTVAERYAPKHIRARTAAGLDPKRTSDMPPLPKETRVRGIAGGLAHRSGVVTKPAWSILPAGQMVVRFDDPIAGYQLIAVTPEEVEPL